MSSRELAREKGFEGYLKKKFPELYESFKAEADKQGVSVMEVLLRYAQYGASVKRWGAIITPEDLEGVDPKALYAAIKLMNWAAQQYFTTLAYANVSAIQAMHQMLMSMMTQYQAMVYAGEEESGEKMVTIPPVPMMPTERKSKTDKLIELVLEGIRAFNAMMQAQSGPAGSISGYQGPRIAPNVIKTVKEAVKKTTEGG